MIDVSGHLRNVRRAIGFEDLEHPLTINCCGCQTFITKDYSQQRTQGRLDYQIIYIFKGAGYYKLNDKWTTLSAGNIVLFRPFEPQVYSYYAKDGSEIYWIHFTGNECETILKKYQIGNCYIGESLSLKLLIQEIILELQLKKPLFEDIIISNFYKILALIHRTFQLQFSPFENNFSIDRLVMQLHQNYMKSWNITSMAQYCNLSEDYFSHVFKKRMGISPIHFLNNLRIEKAKELLFTNSMSISTIASLVGFEDPLYFSRVFKKATGVPPKKFQQSTLLQQTPF